MKNMQYNLPNDPSSYSQPDLLSTRHLQIDWTVDFESKSLKGIVVLTLDIHDDSVKQLVLDSSLLNISKIFIEESGEILKYEVADHDENLGSKIVVHLPMPTSKCMKICVDYSTSDQSTALTWMPPEKTSGKERPFVFSQCQAIHARSLLPCQDTPSVKATYSAKVRCEDGFVVLMSALRKGQEKIASTGANLFRFEQPIPIPSYLIAVVVGDLVCGDVGPRSKVWCEREILDASTYEFAETEKMLAFAEEICGPYEWTQYDLLVLPPSFPYGGMENPCLTFVTPTLLAGDRSLADVIAHEISHSWTGNLVTNCNWEHFWLNEGFTTFIQRKIEGKLHGTPARHLSAIEGWQDLETCIKTRGADDPLTNLVPKLDHVNPDDAFSTVPYEKGHTLLWYLETLVGGPDEFEPFLKSYLAKYRRQSIDTAAFRMFLSDFFPNHAKTFESLDWDSWLHTPGMPPYKPSFDTSLIDACTGLCDRWVSWAEKTEDCPFTAKDLSSFSSNQIIVWMSQLIDREVSLEKVKKMASVYSMDSFSNCEIKFRWLRLCLKVRWEDKVDGALSFVNSQGRMKYVRPIYRDLYAWEAMRKKVQENFRMNSKFMAFVSAYTIAKDLHLN